MGASQSASHARNLLPKIEKDAQICVLEEKDMDEIVQVCLASFVGNKECAPHFSFSFFSSFSATFWVSSSFTPRSSCPPKQLMSFDPRGSSIVNEYCRSDLGHVLQCSWRGHIQVDVRTREQRGPA
eukprot:1199015-Rhodomonas_salina.2